MGLAIDSDSSGGANGGVGGQVAGCLAGGGALAVWGGLRPGEAGETWEVGLGGPGWRLACGLVEEVAGRGLAIGLAGVSRGRRRFCLGGGWLGWFLGWPAVRGGGRVGQRASGSCGLGVRRGRVAGWWGARAIWALGGSGVGFWRPVSGGFAGFVVMVGTGRWPSWVVGWRPAAQRGWAAGGEVSVAPEDPEGRRKAYRFGGGGLILLGGNEST